MNVSGIYIGIIKSFSHLFRHKLVYAGIFTICLFNKVKYQFDSYFKQNEQISSKNELTNSIITVADKLTIQELIAKYNIAVDNKNIDEWTNTWTDDGTWSTTFGEAKGKP